MSAQDMLMILQAKSQYGPPSTTIHTDEMTLPQEEEEEINSGECLSTNGCGSCENYELQGTVCFYVYNVGVTVCGICVGCQI